MKKSFQLSAIAIAIAASSSVMADVQLSIDGTPLSTTISAGTGVNVIAQNNATLNSGPTGEGTVTLATTGTPSSVSNVAYDTIYTRTETQQQSSQVYTPEKLEFTSANKDGTSEKTISRTADVSYDANGDLSGLNNIVQTNLGAPDADWVFDNANATTLSEESLTLGKKSTGAENALTITKTDASGSATTEVTASGVTTGTVTADTIIVDGTDVKATLDQHTTDIAANTAAIAQEVIDRTNEVARLDGRVDQEVADRTNEVARLDGRVDQEVIDRTNEVARLDGRVNQEIADRMQGDADTLAAANTYTNDQVANEAAARIQGDADTLAAANVYTNDQVANEAVARAAGDQAIRNDIATKVTTNELEVNGSSTFNGAVTVNNVKSTTTVDQAGTPATTPEFGADVDGDNRPDTLIQTKEQTDAVTVSSQTQAYNENNLTFSSKVQKGTQTTTDQYTAEIIYDQNGVATYGPNVANGQAVTSDLETIAEDSIIVGKETADSETALTIRSKDANGESATVVTSKSVTTGNVSASTITLAGKDLATTIAEGDAATLASANNYTDATATTLRGEAAAETTRVNQAIADGDATTLASANGYTDATATTLRGEAAAETTRVNQAIADGDATTLASANGYTDATATTLRGEAAAETTRVNQAIADGDATTLASANGYTDATATTLRGEAAAETTRVNKAIADGNTATLASANSYTNARVNQLNSRVDDVEKTAYRGIAIALAAQQAIPSIQPGQIAVFGGVGHYEGETAGAVGLVGALNDRTSLSAALGFAGGNEVGGRVGVAYVFGGK